MNISLTPELDTYVHKKVESGLYHSASEVIREGLRLLQERDSLREAQLAQLRNEIDFGFEQVQRGEYKDYSIGDFDKFMADLDPLARERVEAKRETM